jgi:long-chain fatty acid transport protein
LLASGTRVGYKDADAIARGNAFAATADSPAAVYYNPAGLTQLDGAQFSGSVYAVQPQSDYTSGTGAQTNLKRETHLLPQFYYAYAPHGADYAFGLGAYLPFGLSTNWPATSGFATVATKAEQNDYAFAAVAAYKISPSLSIGGGPVFHRVTTKLSRDILPVPGTSNFTFDGDSNAVSFNLGLRWQASAQHAFGLTYQSNYSAKLDGTSTFTPFLPAPVNASANFVFPEVVIAGYSWRPAPDWNIEFNAEWMNWNRVNDITISNPAALFSPTEVIPLQWRSSFYWDLGATHTFASGLRASFGYTYAENSTPNANFNPAVPDANRHLFGAGLGGRVGEYDLQLTAQYGFAETRTVTGSSNAAADGTYRGRTYALALSVSHRF